MLEYIKGTLTEISPSKVAVEVGGIGYRLFIAVSTLSRLPSIGKEIFFFVTSVIREDSHRLYGFLSKKERDFFEKLNEVSGIGPKLALSLLGHMPLADLYQAITQENIVGIIKIPGIGKKTAERLIIELRDRLKLELDAFSDSFPKVSNQQIIADATSALVNLGYAMKDAQAVVEKAYKSIEDKENLPTLIASALKMKK